MYSFFSSEHTLREFLESVKANCTEESFKEWCEERNNVFRVIGSVTYSADDLMKLV